MNFSLLKLLLVLFICSSCNNELGEFFDELSSLGMGKIILVSSNTTARSVTSYELDGTYSTKLIDYNDVGSTVRGVAEWDKVSVLVSIDAQDRLERVGLSGESEIIATNSQFNGTIYDIDRGPDGAYYVLESNFVERFSATGERSPNTGSTPFIATTTGACVLSNPRSISFSPITGYMYVSTIGGGDLVNIYDISSGAAVCVSSIAFAGLDPQSVLAHTNGYVYVGTNQDDQIWRMNADGSGISALWTTDTSIINNPWALVELPNGEILVSSTGTDSIERISVDGLRLGNTPFIKDSGTFDVTDILIMEVTD